MKSGSWECFVLVLHSKNGVKSTLTPRSDHFRDRASRPSAEVGSARPGLLYICVFRLLETLYLLWAFAV